MLFSTDKEDEQSPGKVNLEPSGEMDGMPQNVENDKGHEDESRALERKHEIDEIPILEDMSINDMELSQTQYVNNPITILASSDSDDTVQPLADDLYMGHLQEE
ncbi:hypothetical protein V6N13_112148 [Hibiscus sabdariffa]